jgi:hypothetical protein
MFVILKGPAFLKHLAPPVNATAEAGVLLTESLEGCSFLLSALRVQQRLELLDPVVGAGSPL